MMVREKGTHTYDIFLHYHECPSCGKIIESRVDYEYRLGKYEKEIDCPRCSHQWTETKNIEPQFGPLFK